MIIEAISRDSGYIGTTSVTRQALTDLLAKMDAIPPTFSLKLLSSSGGYINFELATPSGGHVATDLGGLDNYSTKSTCFCLRKTQARELVAFLNDVLDK